MMSSMQASMMARRPRAPDLRLTASRDTAESALSVNRRLTPSISKSFWYCLIRAFLGSLRMRIRLSSFSSCRVAITGRRPRNSGIMPYLIKSSGWTTLSVSPTVRSFS